MTTLEISATEDETLVDLPPGDVELITPHPVVFWCASPDPSVRAKDYRTELQRLHAGTPITIGAVPEGWKLAISLRPDLPAMYRERPKPEPVAPPPGPTAEELAERALARQIARDMERADLINEAIDLVLERLKVAPAPAPVEPEPPLLPAPDALMSDYGPVGDDITGDMLLDAFELDEAETVAVVQTLSALRLKHLSEQLNVERARLDREHQATGVANPRSASIDRLLGLLTRRGEV
jgi:hypothetical protein